MDLDVGRGEVVGLIGSNGAGKTTLMNAVGGYVPSSGRIEVLGHDVHRTSPARRARLGLGRSFQGAELFPDLTVRETVVLAAPGRGAAARAEADEAIAFLGLGRFVDRFVNELSTGTRRIVELACLMVSGARVLCLDEPTAGIAQRESEAFGPLILRIRAELDAAILVIEHDMPVVMGISDRVYCLEAGRIISEGRPDEVRHDPLVVASYLGTDPDAINRSGTPRPNPHRAHRPHRNWRAWERIALLNAPISAEVDEAGLGRAEAAGVEVERLEVGVEVDVEPLAAGLGRVPRPRPGPARCRCRGAGGSRGSWCRAATA